MRFQSSAPTPKTVGRPVVPLVPRLLELLKAQGAEDIAVVVGGVIPDEDVPELKKAGAADVFDTYATPDEIVSRMRTIAAGRKAS